VEEMTTTETAKNPGKTIEFADFSQLDHQPLNHNNLDNQIAAWLRLSAMLLLLAEI